MTAHAATSAAYIVAGLLFILSLAGLSRHETAKSGVVYGIAGMAVALVATVALAIDHDLDGIGLGLMIVAVLVGAMLQIGHENAGITAVATAAILLASINVFGGFAVTRRMLAMFTRS